MRSSRQRALSQHHSSADPHHGQRRPLGHNPWQRPPTRAVVPDPALPQAADVEARVERTPQRPPADRPLLLRVEDVCELLTLSRSTVTRLITNGLLPSVTLGTSRRVIRSQVEEFVARLAAGEVIVEPRRAGRKARS